ncbi:MAG: chemotaxis protein CheW [Proteobacteria bacterium]|nr:chemotaxis protein CheW [Pseudomonadota bacterium]
MHTATEGLAAGLATQYVTFRVGPLFFGVDVAQVQEVLRYQPMTPVPLAPAMVKGLVNLRGQIIAALDLREMLRLTPFASSERPMNVVIRTGTEVVSLLVDSIGDVMEVSPASYEEVPETVSAHLRSLVRGVFKLEEELLLAVDVQSLVDSKRTI